jgi:hypothetical protein
LKLPLQVHVYSSAVCEVYTASLDAVGTGQGDAPFNLTANFRRAVAGMPEDLEGSNKDRMTGFVREWGTHFTTVGRVVHSNV